jgi:hypothetical protein
LEVVAEEAQLEPYVKADQLLAPSQKEWRVKPPREEFFSWMSNPVCELGAKTIFRFRHKM